MTNNWSSFCAGATRDSNLAKHYWAYYKNLTMQKYIKYRVSPFIQSFSVAHTWNFANNSTVNIANPYPLAGKDKVRLDTHYTTFSQMHIIIISTVHIYAKRLQTPDRAPVRSGPVFLNALDIIYAHFAANVIL